MAEVENGQNTRHAVIRYHRCLHTVFTPTHITLGLTHDSANEHPNGEWQSRRSRKARYAPVPHIIASTDQSHGSKGSHSANEATSDMENMLVNLRVQTLTTIKPHLIMDVTFWLAVTFTLGSAIWVVNGEHLVATARSIKYSCGTGFLVWMPILSPSLDTNAFTNAAAASGFIGGSVFEVGSYLMVLEALNR
jgi:hypothetical protein